ncbi:MAG: hypothetical protein HKN01_01535 [Acidimicrobiia bacterium]|nr:hypothetical protein [Acidimicrobiia bacterium]
MATLKRTSSEKLPTTVTSPSDPSGSGAPDFAVTALDVNVAPTSGWVAGEWTGTFNTALKRMSALTPTMPAVGSGLDVAEGDWKLWCRFSITGETPVQEVGGFTVE